MYPPRRESTKIAQSLAILQHLQANERLPAAGGETLCGNRDPKAQSCDPAQWGGRQIRAQPVCRLGEMHGYRGRGGNLVRRAGGDIGIKDAQLPFRGERQKV